MGNKVDQTHKFDAGKPQYSLIPPFALAAVAEVLTYGAQKYASHTWILVESNRYMDAAFRHLESRRMGLETDEESGRPHLAMAITNLMFLLERDMSYDNTTVGEKFRGYFEEIRQTREEEG